MKANVKPVEQGKEKQSLELLETKAVLNISIVSVTYYEPQRHRESKP